MPIVRLPGGDLRDEIRQPLYSAVSVAGSAYTAALAGNYQIANVLGGQGPVPGSPTVQTNCAPNLLDQYQFFSQSSGEAQWQTNLTQNGSLQTAVSFRVQGMAMDASYINNEVLSVNQSFLQNLQAYSSVRVHIGEKDYWTGPSQYLMGRIVQDGAVAYIEGATPPAAATLAGFVAQHAGQPAVQGVVLSGRHVVDINPLQAFYALLSVDVPAYINSICNLDSPANLPLVGAVGGPFAAQGGMNDIVSLTFSFKGLQRRPVQ